MTRILLTGFPGFLGSRLLHRLLQGETTVTCLVEPRMARRARESVLRLEETRPEIDGRIRLVEGDLTDPAVLAPGQRLGSVHRIYHLAAAYRLDVDREVGMAVNVRGTRYLLDLARRLPELRGVHHVSTCYVSGRHPGLFRETDLDVGQRFNNHYEETKFLSEVAVAEAREEGLPVAVYRPSVVTGDARTGETAKFDGVYYLIRWIAAQGRVALVPRLPGSGRAVFNVVPSDVVIAALARLSEHEDSLGRTFHLADPDPLPVPELVRACAAAVGRRALAVPCPGLLARRFTAWARHLPRFPGIPAEAMAYLSHPTRYGTDGTTPALAREGIEIPRFPEYVDALVSYWAEAGGPEADGPPGEG